MTQEIREDGEGVCPSLHRKCNNKRRMVEKGCGGLAHHDFFPLKTQTNLMNCWQLAACLESFEDGMKLFPSFLSVNNST